jgi:hypothetical protein
VDEAALWHLVPNGLSAGLIGPTFDALSRPESRRRRRASASFDRQAIALRNRREGPSRRAGALLSLRTAYSEDVLGQHKVLPNIRPSATPRSCARPAPEVGYAGLCKVGQNASNIPNPSTPLVPESRHSARGGSLCYHFLAPFPTSAIASIARS